MKQPGSIRHAVEIAPGVTGLKDRFLPKLADWGRSGVQLVGRDGDVSMAGAVGKPGVMGRENDVRMGGRVTGANDILQKEWGEDR